MALIDLNNPPKETDTKLLDNTDIENKAIGIVKAEHDQWNTASAFITDRISFEMRSVLKRARKNYYGIFDEQQDKITGLDKIWVPLTEWVVETWVKNIDIDTKDIQLRAKHPGAQKLTSIVRQVLKSFLDRLGFGEILNEGQRSLCIDGTWIQKSWEGYDFIREEKTLRTKKIDLLNWWIDPSAKDIQSAYSVIERSIMTPEEISKFRGVWMNVDKINFKRDLHTTDEYLANVTGGEVDVIDVYERWGKMPKALITGIKNDWSIWIDGRIVVSGLGSSKTILHKIEENKKHLKPYEEVWLRRVPNRWHGRGLAEQLFNLQLYLNEVINTRRVNNLLFHNKLFEFRKGSGIRAQDLSRLVAGGAIPVTEIGKDIREIPISDMKASSYRDEEVLYDMATRVTGAQPITGGEPIPATTPATNAQLQNQNARTSYGMAQQDMGLFLKRLIERHYFPIIFNSLKDEEIIHILGDPEEVRVFDEVVIKNLLEDWMFGVFTKTGFMPELIDQDLESEKLRKHLRGMGAGRYTNFKKSLANVSDYDVSVYVTQEDFDKNTILKQLNDLLISYSKLTKTALDTDAVMREVMDIMGLGSERFFLPEKQSNPVPGITGLGQPGANQPQQNPAAIGV